MTTAIGTALVLFIGIRNVQSGVLTLGELLMVIAYVAQLYNPLRTISRQVGTLQSALASAERAFELLDEVPDVVERLMPAGSNEVPAKSSFEMCPSPIERIAVCYATYPF